MLCIKVLLIAALTLFSLRTGQGRRSRTWASGDGGNIYLTFLYSPSANSFNDMKLLNFGAALAVVNACKNQGWLGEEIHAHNLSAYNTNKQQQMLQIIHWSWS